MLQTYLVNCYLIRIIAQSIIIRPHMQCKNLRQVIVQYLVYQWRKGTINAVERPA